jgi:hypothetical protein
MSIPFYKKFFTDYCAGMLDHLLRRKSLLPGWEWRSGNRTIISIIKEVVGIPPLSVFTFHHA